MPRRTLSRPPDSRTARSRTMPQVYFEDVSEGTRLPTLVKTPTTQQLVMFACATYDYYELHYDRQYALENGVDDVIVHGPLKNSFLAQLVTDWMGEAGIAEEAERPVQGHGHAGLARLCGGNCYTEVCPLRREPRRVRSQARQRRWTDHDARQRGGSASLQTIGDYANTSPELLRRPESRAGGVPRSPNEARSILQTLLAILDMVSNVFVPR